MIYTSYSPNTRIKDLMLNISLLFFPWQLTKGEYAALISEKFSKSFVGYIPYTFNYARSGMYLLFKSLELQPTDEVIMQGFTCIAAVNPIRATGAKVIYCDISKDTLNFDVTKLKALITGNTKAILFQHTFGNSFDIEEVVQICKENNILLIEDCTNTVFGRHKDQLIGSFGDASIFSFGRDKAISGVAGGVILIKNQSLKDKFSNLYVSLSYPSISWTVRELMYPLLWFVIKSTYKFGIGKLFHFIFTKLHFITKATTVEEKKGNMPLSLVSKMPNALACLAYTQLVSIDAFNAHRVSIVEIYKANLHSVSVVEGNILLRFPIFVKNKSEVLSYMRANDIQLGDWYDKPITPSDVDLATLGYVTGSCPVSESVTKQLINLPTHINVTVADANLIIKLLKGINANN